MKTKLLFFLGMMITTIVLSMDNDNNPNEIEAHLKKYNPGHYVAISERGKVDDIKYLDEPAVRGVSKRYPWKMLEPNKGEYDFSAIRSDLEFLSRHKKQLVVFLIDKSFSETHVLPDYLSKFELKTRNGYCAKRWDPEVMARLIALGQALADEFDSHPNFEGVAIQESALGPSDEVLAANGYTPEKYRDALINTLKGLKSAMRYSQVFWYQNFLPHNNGYLRDIANSIIPDQIIMGGPDILPYRISLLEVTYPLYEEFKDKLPLFCSAQGDSYQHHKNDTMYITNDGKLSIEEIHPDGYISMEEIFLFARDKLHVNYLFWSYKPLSRKGEHNYDDAIEVIRKYPVFNQ